MARTSGGSVGAASMRLIIDAERPVALWLPLRIVQTVLRGTPKILACSSSVRKPAASTVSASSLILDNWRAFISALTKQGRSLRTCAKGSSWFMQMVAVSVDVPYWISLNLNAPTTPATQFGFKVSVRPGASRPRNTTRLSRRPEVPMHAPGCVVAGAIGCGDQNIEP